MSLPQILWYVKLLRTCLDDFKNWDEDPNKACSPVFVAKLLENARALVEILDMSFKNPPSPTNSEISDKVYNRLRIFRLTVLTLYQGQ